MPFETPREKTVKKLQAILSDLNEISKKLDKLSQELKEPLTKDFDGDDHGCGVGFGRG